MHGIDFEFVSRLLLCAIVNDLGLSIISDFRSTYTQSLNPSTPWNYINYHEKDVATEIKLNNEIRFETDTPTGE